MAGEFAKFYIRLGTLFDPKGLQDAEKSIKDTDKSASGLQSSFTKIAGLFAGGAAIYKMIGFAQDAWAAYARQEEVTARLNQQLRTQGIYSDGLSRALQKIASDIQRVTTVGDEDTLAMMQLGLSMGVSADKMDEASRQAIGLSKAYGVDLNSAMKMVALAGQGEYTMLQRYIPQLRCMTTEAEKAAAVKKLLADGFAIATAEAETADGKIKNLKNRLGDLNEYIGSTLVKTVIFWADKLSIVIGWLEKLTASTNETSASLSRNEKELIAVNEQMKIQARLVQGSIEAGVTSGKVYEDRVAKLNKLTDASKRLTAQVLAERAATKAAPTLATKPEIEPPVVDEAAAKKQAEDRLKNVDQWYSSARGAVETSYLKFRNDEEIAWGEMSLKQKEALMTRAQEIYARDNATMSGSFMQSLDRMQSSGMGWAQAWDGMWAQTTSGMASNIQTFLTSSGNMFKNFQKLLDGIFKSILNSFISMVSQMIAKWLLLRAITGIFGGGVGMKLLGSFKDGGPIPETGPYLLHKGEEVIPADIANSVRNSPGPSFAPVAAGAGMGAGAAPSVTVSQNITIGGTSETDIAVIADKLSKATRAGVLAAVDLAKVNYKVGLKRAEETSI